MSARTNKSRLISDPQMKKFFGHERNFFVHCENQENHLEILKKFLYYKCSTFISLKNVKC